jgi:lipoprotein-anchoring transpeptidase ErfK/SrfK
MKYHVPAAHLRLVQPEEFAPISPEIDPWKKRIVVSIGKQTLRAYENEQLVLETQVSTGVGNWRNIPGLLSTETPLGDYNVISKMPSKHMGNGAITSNYEDYELPGVPWTSFFVETGVAIHGTYWHQNYGTPMSHGCVNVPTDIARWIFRWTSPVSEPQTWEQRGRGTQVEVTG